MKKPYRHNQQEDVFMKKLQILSLIFLFALTAACNGTLIGNTSSDNTGSADDTAEEQIDGHTEPNLENQDTNGDGCPNEIFLDVAAEEGPGANYPAPELNVSCTATEMTVTSNGITHYPYEDTNPNDMSVQNHSWTITLNPQVADTITEIPLLGDVGFAINGIPFYGPNEAAFPDPYGDPVFNGIMDECMGHPGGQADYHYHSLLVRA